MRANPIARSILAFVTGISLSFALLSVKTSAVPGAAVVALAFLAAALAVWALPSVGSSIGSKLIVVLGAYVVGVHGDFSGVGAAGSMLVWLAATVTVLAFPHIDRNHGLTRATVVAAVPLALCLFAAGTIGATRLAASPSPTPLGAAADGEGDAGPNDPLRSSLTMDMTRRPRLSDRALFTVATDRATFWRTNVFDRWNGWEWSRSRLDLVAAPSGLDVVTPPGELPQTSAVEVRQDIELLADARALPAAATVRRIDVDGPVGLIGGTDLASLSAVGPGTRYTVISAVPDVTIDDLAAARNRDIPPEIAERYLDPGPVERRTAELAQSFESDSTRPWDLVGEIDSWLSANTDYSLDSPTSPRGSNVVEDFLFESRLGWCEQIASSLVVLLRLQGVPARLAVGYVPVGQTVAGDRWLARERDAHAWAEVWINGIGWVPVDPTASVSVAEPAAPRAVTVLEVAALAALTALAGWFGLRLVLRLWSRRSAPRRGRVRLRTPWSPAPVPLVTGEQRLFAIGRTVGLEPAPAESVTAFGANVAAHTGIPEASHAGARLDELRYRFGGDHGSAPARAVDEVQEWLDHVERLTSV